MLIESFIAATLASSKHQKSTNLLLKDVGIVLHELQPQITFRHGYKKSSVAPGCLAVSDTHIFAAQAEKATVHVYNRLKGNQEATIPFPDRIRSLCYLDGLCVLVLGTEHGKLMLWEVGTGRVVISAAAHLQPVTVLSSSDRDLILSAATDNTVHVWSVAELLSLLPAPGSFGSTAAVQPIRSFSSHRSGISALVCGHAKSSINFAISASTDGTCYMWRLADCQVLRTFLLPFSPQCLVLDPADRAAYVAYDNSQLQMIDLLQHKQSLANTKNVDTVQLNAEDAWIHSASSVAAIRCLDLSYDGTLLLTGIEDGKVQMWDVGKGRFLREVVDLISPVTAIHILKPTGFIKADSPRFTIPNVVKPNMELSAPAPDATSRIPPSYALHVQIQPTTSPELKSLASSFAQDLYSPYFPQHTVDAAIQDLILQNAGIAQYSTPGDPSDPSKDMKLAKVEQLQSQVASLETKISGLTDHIAREDEKRLEGINYRASLKKEKVRAFFQAKKDGKSGFVAMEEWDDKIENENGVEMKDAPPNIDT